MGYKIAVFPGDGIGPELIESGIKIIRKSAELDKFEIEFVKYPYGAEHYLETKEVLSDKILKSIKDSCHAVYCGTFENIKPEAGMNLRSVPAAIRSYFDQFIALRPIRMLPNVDSLLRESTEDFYVGASGTAKNGKNKSSIKVTKSSFKAKFGLGVETKGNEIAYQIGILSRKGCDRFVRFSFDYAKSKGKNRIHFIDKANLLEFYNFWRESVNKISKGYEGIEYEFNLIDSAAMHLIMQPEKYQLIAAPNMFGDILGDLCTAIQGGLAFAAQGNINPEGISMFEPIHGSAPKLKDKGIVNPVATIWAAALMLDTIGQQNASNLVIKSIESVLKEGKTRTQDLGGNNTTSEMADAIADKLIGLHD